MYKNIIKIMFLLILIDIFYLQSIGKNVFIPMLNNIQNEETKVKLLYAVLCYVFLAYGLNHFIIQNNKTIKDAFILGVVIYGVYETTSMALLNKWTTKAVVIDTIWGGILFSATTFIYNKYLN